MMEHETDPSGRAKVGYDAYGDYVNWTNYAGDPMPQWDELPETQRHAWIAAAGAIELHTVTELNATDAASGANVNTFDGTNPALNASDDTNAGGVAQ